MYINGVDLLSSIGNNNTINNEEKKVSNNFGDFLTEALNKVNDKQLKSDEITQSAIIGDVDNVHDVLIAAEEAKLSLELTVQIRNKIVDAYQEINRMQI